MLAVCAMLGGEKCRPDAKNIHNSYLTFPDGRLFSPCCTCLHSEIVTPNDLSVVLGTHMDANYPKEIPSACDVSTLSMFISPPL